MVATAEVNALAKLAHRNLRINAPTGRILTREQLSKSSYGQSNYQE
jgi:hypothetical protein